MKKFDVQRYKELLTKNKSLNKTNKDLFYEPDFIELFSCEASLETQIFYNRREKYFNLIREYLVETIDPSVFRTRFTRMVREDLKKAHQVLDDFEQLSNFLIDSGLDEFSSLFEEINEKCLNGLEFEDNIISEDKLRDSIREIFFQMQKYLDG